jgi:hypothetical protein
VLALTAERILRIWEIGAGQSSSRRAMTILNVALADASSDDVAAWTVGRRDAYLLDLCEATFGARLTAYEECPRCGERLEFTVRVPEMRVDPPSPSGGWHELTADGYALRFRLPRAGDLAAVSDTRDVDEACRGLFARCVIEVSHAGAQIDVAEVPDSIVRKIASRMAECDPQAEIVLELRCHACHHNWPVLFDIATFFWAEVSAHARRLIRDVHALARAYGWREVEILSMSGWRRERYLEQLGV